MRYEIKRYKNIIKKIDKFEAEFAKLSERDFPAKTATLKMRVKSGLSLDVVLPEAFALVKEVSKRKLHMEPFDVQLAGAIAAHEENIVEMKTGEGKTLTIVFVAYLNSLAEKGVHVVTANDYLAQRDAKWMGLVYKALGLSVSAITSQSNDFDRQVGYASDVTYVTNNEVCFDYLKDNMLYQKENKRQRDLYFAIIDEADSVLIDEAQIPLVISDNQSSKERDKELFSKVNNIVKELKRNIDFKVDRKSQTVSLTIAGIKKIETFLGVDNLYGQNNEDYLYYVERLLKAQYLFKKDKDYIVENGRVVIVDEYTGRLMHNHRYFQGLHQALEVKEGLAIQDETRTLASISFQHFFKKYQKMAGFSGTAKTAQREFLLIYKKNVVQIPTNEPVIRNDLEDRFFLSWEDKLRYLSWTVQEYYFKGRPVLIGTRSVGKSQEIQESLISENIASNVLNAKHTSREAEVIAETGKNQAVTVATNMAGRGTDIELDDRSRESGGLVIFGTERHNARRIDDQLIGRAGRQGDPGLTQFLISSDDELVRTYFREEYERRLKKFKNLEQGIYDLKLAKILQKAQKRMEGIFFEQRVLNYEFDKVLDKQRNSFYEIRNGILEDSNFKDEMMEMIKLELDRLMLEMAGKKKRYLTFEQAIDIADKVCLMISNGWFKLILAKNDKHDIRELTSFILKSVENYYRDFENYVTPLRMREIEKIVALKTLDMVWIGYLDKVESLQEAALIGSISRSDFFEEYELQMGREYQRLVKILPTLIVKTFFRTVNRMWK